MKRTNILLAVMALLLAADAFSQGISFGVRAGLNVSNLTMTLPPNLWPADNKKQSRTSFNLGVYGQRAFGEKTAAQVELLYSGEGAKFSNPGTELPGDVKLGYLALPVLFKYSFGKGIYAMAGPQLSYLLTATTKYNNGTEYDVLDRHNKVNFSFVPALGYDWKDFSINFRYQLGLSKLPSSSNAWYNTPYSDAKVKSNVFSVVLGYRLKKE